MRVYWRKASKWRATSSPNRPISLVLAPFRSEPCHPTITRMAGSWERREPDLLAGGLDLSIVEVAGGNEALVVDQSADQDDQDWRTVGAPCRKAGVSAC